MSPASECRNATRALFALWMNVDVYLDGSIRSNSMLVRALAHGPMSGICVALLRARMLSLATVWTTPYGIIGLLESKFALPSVLAVSAAGVLGTGLAFVIMGTLVGRVGSTRASFITYVIPVVALVPAPQNIDLQLSS